MMHEVRSTSSARTPAWTAADMTFSDIKYALNTSRQCDRSCCDQRTTYLTLLLAALLQLAARHVNRRPCWGSRRVKHLVPTPARSCYTMLAASFYT